MGIGGPVPRRVDAPIKSALLDLLDQAVGFTAISLTVSDKPAIPAFAVSNSTSRAPSLIPSRDSASAPSLATCNQANTRIRNATDPILVPNGHQSHDPPGNLPGGRTPEAVRYDRFDFV